MVIGVLTIDLLVGGSSSLKDKRQVMRSLLDGIRNRYNVSAAELSSLDSWRHAEIGVTCISNDKGVANTILNKVLANVEANPRVTISGCRIEFL